MAFMTRAAQLSFRKRQFGFTLVELLLVVSLVLILASAMVFNFSTLLRGNQLAEGTTRLETLMRFARAQAANSGRRVQLVFSEESTNTPAASTGEVRATWERDPLGEPGCFADLCEAQWHVQEINNLVQVESVQLFDAGSACPTYPNPRPTEEEVTASDASPAKPKTPITFYPDGSSDSAEIIVAPRTQDEGMRMSVRLIGMTGSISHQLVSTEMDEGFGEAGVLDRSGTLIRGGAGRDATTELQSTPRPLSTLPPAAAKPPPATLRRAVGETNLLDHRE